MRLSMNRQLFREVLDCAGRAERRRRFRIARNSRDRVGIRKKSVVGKWKNIFDGSLCEQSDLPTGTTVVDGSLREQPHSKTCAVPTSLCANAANPNGIASSSPGLRGTNYPGYGGERDDNSERVVSRVTHSVGNPMDTTPLGLNTSGGPTPGTSCLATLGFVAESLWDSINLHAGLCAMHRSKTLAGEPQRSGRLWPRPALKGGGHRIP